MSFWAAQIMCIWIFEYLTRTFGLVYQQNQPTEIHIKCSCTKKSVPNRAKKVLNKAKLRRGECE